MKDIAIEEFDFYSGGVKLAGAVYFPRDTGDLYLPAVLICHGIPGSPYNPQDTGYADFARRLAEQNFLVMIFNFRGCGKSGGNMDMRGWRTDFEAAVDYLARYLGDKKIPIYVIGFSGGAAVAACEAADNKRVDGVALCACPANFNFFKTQGVPEFFLEKSRSIGIVRDPDFPRNLKSWTNGYLELKPENYVAWIAERPVLIIHGSADETVALDNAYRLFKRALEPKELRVIEGAGHRLREYEETFAVLLKWLKGLSA